MGVLAGIVHFLLEPLHIMLLLVLCLVMMVWHKGRGRQRRWIRIIGVMLLVWASNLALPVVPYYMVMVLENRFPAGDDSNLDLIIILGGWQGDGLVQARRGGVGYGSAADRLLHGLDIASRNPRAEVILSGGLKTYANGLSEEEISRAALDQLGRSDPRFRIEGASTNTFENAVETLRGISADGRIGLVTSAAHMPRSMGVFRAQGLNPIPLPTDFQTTGGHPHWHLLYRNGGDLTRRALREWVGLIAYRLMGRSHALFPGP